MSNPRPPSSSRRARRPALRVHGKDLALPDGRSLIGRSDACRVVIDDPRVSRRHARIEVMGDRAEVVDLESANGVRINGQSLGRGSHPLRHGDVISIGGHSLLYQVLDGVSLTDDDASHGTLAAVFTADAPAPPSHRRQPTKVTAATDLVTQVCEQALDAGHVDDAARVLHGHLTSMVEDVRSRRAVPEAKRAQAVALALRLAHASGSGEWFDHVVDLLRHAQVVCSPEFVAKLRQALEKVDAVDAAKLRAYVADLRGLPSSMETLRAAQELDQLARRAVSLHRPRLRHNGETWRAPAPDASTADHKPKSSGRA